MHSPECAATLERKGFILNLIKATKYQPWGASDLASIEGTEQELKDVWSELRGIFNEYGDDGDQMAEACDCGHADRKA
jgi:hypothetical protein